MVGDSAEQLVFETVATLVACLVDQQVVLKAVQTDFYSVAPTVQILAVLTVVELAATLELSLGKIQVAWTAVSMAGMSVVPMVYLWVAWLVV